MSAIGKLGETVIDVFVVMEGLIMNKTSAYLLVALFFSGISPIYAMQKVQQKPAQPWILRYPLTALVGIVTVVVTGNVVYDSYQRHNSPREICHFRHRNEQAGSGTTAMTSVGTHYLCDEMRRDSRYVEVAEASEPAIEMGPQTREDLLAEIEQKYNTL